MKRRNIFLFILFSIALLLSCTNYENTVLFTNTYTVSGSVKSSKGIAYKDATVTLSNELASIRTRTDSAGEYSFFKIPSGSYTISLDVPTGYASDTTRKAIKLSGANSTNNNFIIKSLYSISGTVSTSTGEKYNGATVTLSGASSATTTTATDGTYSFPNLADGSYTVTLTVPDTYIATETEKTIALSGADSTGNDFTITKTYLVSGAVNISTGGTYSGAFVRLTGTSIDTTTTTGSDGSFYFRVTENGSYALTLTVPDDCTASSATIPVTMSSADNTSNYFTITRNTYTISGTVKTSEGNTYGNAELTLRNSSFVILAKDTTASDGTYSFSAISGTYTVTLTVPDNHTAAISTKPVVVNRADSTGNDFTITENTYSVSGTVNISPSGTYNGATITLSGTSSATTTTSADGSYSFTGLKVGSYTVKLTNPSEYFSKDTIHNFTISNANITGQNFTIKKTHSIKGNVSGYANGVTLTLSGDSSAILTGVNGSYSFNGLVSGKYHVTITLPPTYIANDTTLDIDINEADSTNNNFNLTPTYTISGNIKLNGINFTESASVTISGGSLTVNKTITTTNGAYSFSGLTTGNYTVTLSTPSGYYCANTTTVVSSLSGDIPNQDFTLAPTYSIGGTITGYSSETVTVTLTDYANNQVHQATPNGNGGTYTFAGLIKDSTYTVTLTIPDNYIADDTTEAYTVTGPITKNFKLTPTYSMEGTITGYSGGNVTVTLTDYANNQVQQATLNGNGETYTFAGLIKDSTYTVTLTIPDNYIANDTTETYTVTGAVTKNFNLTPTYSMEGTITGYSGGNVTVTLTDYANNQVQQATLNGNGETYTFAGLIKDSTYTVTLTIPDNYIANDTTETYTVTGAVTKNFNLTPTYSMEGTITGYSGGNVTVTLTDYANNQVQQATLNGNGETYTFAGLIKDSTYTVTLTIPDNYIANDTTETYTVTGAVTKNFNLTPTYSMEGTITGYSGGNVTVTLTDYANNQVQQATLNGNGETYTFAGLIKDSTYTVTLTIPDNYIANDTTETYTVTGAVTKNFNLTPTYSMEGTITGYSGGNVTVTLTDYANNQVQQATLNGNGETYTFAGLIKDSTYTVTLTIPDNYIANDTTETYTVTGAVTKNFNLTPTYSMEGTITGYSGGNVTVTLTDYANNQVQQATLNGNGETYTFAGLIKDSTYTVTLTIPDNYIANDTTETYTVTGAVTKNFNLTPTYSMEGTITGYSGGNVTVTLTDYANNQVQQATLNGNGETYTFAGLIKDSTYTVTLTIPDNYIANDTTETYTVTGPITKGFNLTPTYSMEGTITGYSSGTVTVTLTDYANNQVQQATLNGNGETYTFAGLIKDSTYTVTLTIPDNYIANDTTETYTVTGAVTKNFNLTPTYSMEGTITGYSGGNVTVTLTDYANNQVQQATLNGNGETYTFAGLIKDSTYTVTLTIPDNYIANDTTETYTVTGAVTKNFNLTPTYSMEGTITGYSGGNVTVTLTDYANNQVQQATLNGNGETYTFAGLIKDSTYTVTLTIPDNYIANDTTETYTVTGAVTKNFNLTPTYSMEGTITGYSGGNVTVTLTDYANNQVQQATLNGNGETYTFAGLIKDSTYTVTLTIPDDYIAADTTETYTVTGPITKGFNLIPTYSISGKVNILSESNTSDYTDGASLTLYNSSADSIASATSTSDGSYSFSGLVAENYTVKLTNPTGYFTKDTTLSITVSNGNVTGQNFTIQKTYSIKGAILNYGGVTLTLSGDSSATLTGVSGNYSFDGLVSGKYHVTIDIPEDWIANDTTLDIDINEADSTGNDFTLTQTYFISGEVSNGATGEKYENATLKLYFVVPGVSKDSVATTTTASDGSYKFSGITTTGSYEVRLTTPSGYYAPTTTISVSLTSSNISWKNFTIWKYHTISGKVTGHGSDTLRLSGNSNTSPTVNFNDTVTTDANGDYTFNVPNGSYNVTLTIPNSYIADDTTKSITVSNADSTNNNFILTPTYTISGTVSKTDGGTYKGAVITLYNSNPDSIAASTTIDDGIYSFSGLLEGTYTVALTVPTNYTATTATSLSSIAVNSTNGNSTGNNFTIEMNATALTREELITKIKNKEDVTNVNTSAITNMASLFATSEGGGGYDPTFNQDISNWDVSNVTDMHQMFYGNTTFNQNLNNWKGKLNKVTDMSQMFCYATSFNQNLRDWDVSNVTNMKEMFKGATAFNGDISTWEVSSDTTMYAMFYEASSFNCNISGWDVSNVTTMEATFCYANNFNQDIGNWNVSKVTNMESMFSYDTTFNQNLNKWDVRNVTDMNHMFNHAYAFNDSISNWDVSKVRDMNFMFKSAKVFNQDITGWNVGNVIDMSYMFQFTDNFNQNIGNWDVSQVINMFAMFHEALAFNGNIGNWKEKTANVTNMGYMLFGTKNFDQDISDWNLSKVNNMEYMFNGASIFNQNLIKWNTWTQNLPTPPGFDTNANAWELTNKPTFSN